MCTLTSHPGAEEGGGERVPVHAVYCHGISPPPPSYLGTRLAQVGQTLNCCVNFPPARVLFKQVGTTGAQRDSGRKDKVCPCVYFHIW